MNKKFFIILNLFCINLYAAQSKSKFLDRSSCQSDEVKIRHEDLQAVHLFGQTDPFANALKKLLSKKLVHAQNGNHFPLVNLILQYAELDFNMQASWDIDKLPIGNSLPKGKFILSGPWLLSYIFNNNQELEFTQRFKPHDKNIIGILNLKDGRLVTYGADTYIRIWQEQYGIYELQQQLNGHQNEIWNVIELEDGTLASVSVDCKVRIWQTNENNLFKCVQLLDHVYPVTSIIKVNNNLITGSYHSIYLWQKNNQGIWQCESTQANAYNAILWKSLGLKKLDENIFISCNKKEAIIWQIEGTNIKEIQRITDQEDIDSLDSFDKFLLFRTQKKAMLYEKINNKWEHSITFHGHVSEKDQCSYVFHWCLVNENEIAIVSSDGTKLDNNKISNFYITIYRNEKLNNNWIKKTFYLGKSSGYELTYNEKQIIIYNPLTPSHKVFVLSRACADDPVIQQCDKSVDVQAAKKKKTKCIIC